MTFREKLARALCTIDERNGGPPWDWYSHPKQREHFFEGVDAILEEMAGDPGHDITEGVVAPTKDRTEAMRIWHGMIANIRKGEDRDDG